MGNEGRSVPCAGCGAPLPITLEGDLTGHTPLVAHCGYCRTQTPVPPALLEELQRYAAQRAEHARHATHQQLATAAQRIELAEASAFSPAALIWAFAPMLTLSGLFQVAAWLELVTPNGALAGLVQGASGLLIPAGWGGYLWFQHHAARQRNAQALPSALAAPGACLCPNCGALTRYCTPHPPTRTARGATGDAVCQYCRAPLLPPSRALDEALSAAARVARSARLQRYASARRGQHSWIDRLRVPLGFAVDAACAVAAVIAGFAVPWISTETVPELAPHAALLVTAGSLLGLLVGAALAGYWASRLAKVARFREAYRAWAAAIGGQICSYRQASDWLDQHWAGEFRSDLAVSGFGARIALVVHGHPVLCVIDPISWGADHNAAIHVYVATEWGTADQKLVGQGNTQLRQLGFVPNQNEGGVLVRGSGDDIQRFSQPREIAALSEVISWSVQLARSSAT